VANYASKIQRDVIVQQDKQQQQQDLEDGERMNGDRKATGKNRREMSEFDEAAML